MNMLEDDNLKLSTFIQSLGAPRYIYSNKLHARVLLKNEKIQKLISSELYCYNIWGYWRGPHDGPI